MNGQFTLKGRDPGDTKMLHPHIIDFRKHGLTWLEPFWVPRFTHNNACDAVPIMNALSASPHVVLIGGDNIPGYIESFNDQNP